MEVYHDTKEFGRLAAMFANAGPLFRQSVTAALRRSGATMRKDIARGARSVSYLQGRVITRSIGRLQVRDGEASLRVAAKNQPGHKFRLSPNRITARKGRRSRDWQSPDVLKGPGLAPLNPRIPGFSRPFIAQIGSLKGYFVRDRASGELLMPAIASPQYFAAFDAVKGPVLKNAGDTFLKRLNHEIDYRLGLK